MGDMNQTSRNGYTQLINIARDAISQYLENLPPSDSLLQSPELSAQKGVFVTLTTKNGDLRGCIGHIFPQYPSLIEEVQNVAILSATQDPRFDPVTRDELSELNIEISILEPPEPVASKNELDAKKYGVIVRNGLQTGVLLPDLEGIDTVDEQLSIALMKAGINPSKDYSIERFVVRKVS